MECEAKKEATEDLAEANPKIDRLFAENEKLHTYALTLEIMVKA